MITPEQLAEWRAVSARLVKWDDPDVICAALEAFPALLDEVGRLQDENTDLRAAIEEARLELARWRNAGVGA